MSKAAETPEHDGSPRVVNPRREPATTQSPAPEPTVPETSEHPALGQLAGVLRRELAAFLGLVPLTIGALRVFLMGQGDQGTTFTLIRTLDLQALLMGTFFRYAGLFGVATALYILFRGLWPRMRARWRESLEAQGVEGADSRLPGSDSRALALVLLLLVASAGGLYSEQLFDEDGSWQPVDMFRAELWTFAVFLLFLVTDWAFGLLARRLRAEGSRAGLARRGLLGIVGAAATLSHTGRRFFRSSWPEAWVLVPAVVFLLWSCLIANDRMWLPAQMITIKASPDSCLSLPPDALGSCSKGKYDPALTQDKETRFIGYVLDADLVEETILRPGGGVVVVHRDEIKSVVTCQYEKDFDPRADKPYFDQLNFFQAAEASRQNLTCDDVLHVRN